VKNDDEFAAEIARVWDAGKAAMHARLDAVDAAGAALLAGSLDDERRAAATAAAHKLAGSLGTFGLPEGSRLARELELMLRAPGVPAVMRLSELAEDLRAIVLAGPAPTATAVTRTAAADADVITTTEADRGQLQVDVVMVDDDVVLTELVRHALETRGYSVTIIQDGKAGVEALIGPPPLRCRLLLLDVDLPGLDGFAILRRLTAAGVTRTTPTIMLTVRASETEVLEALRSGAIDHVTKPFSMRELMARVKALIRRSAARADGDSASKIVAGDLELDTRGRGVTRSGQDVPLKPKEFDLFAFMAKNAGQVFTRSQILEQVWGYDFFGGSRTVDVHIRWLREKLEHEPSRPKHLLTVRGVGYKFVR